MFHETGSSSLPHCKRWVKSLVQKKIPKETGKNEDLNACFLDSDLFKKIKHRDFFADQLTRIRLIDEEYITRIGYVS